MIHGVGSKWWSNATLYQIYVRSWKDSNGDGVGDFRGLIENFNHIVELGVDGVWLSPINPSPNKDYGYDVSDYVGINPEYGTIEDFKELIALFNENSLKLIMDLVPNHTSSQHRWFIEANKSSDNVYRDYYVWSSGREGGSKPPNNWIDATGASAWTFDEKSGQYFLHNFLVDQPDLNWWNLKVQQEFEDILKFWFDLGVDGFRIDVAHGIFKDAELRDDPPAQGGELGATYGNLPVYSANRPEVHGLYKSWRAIAEEYKPERLLLGETWVNDPAALVKFFGDDDELQLTFNFGFVMTKFSARGMHDAVHLALSEQPLASIATWTGSNHDISRFPTRWCGDDEDTIRLALVLLFTLPGVVVLYYGDEIGTVDADISREQMVDTMSLDSTKNVFLRDRARTPLHWSDAPGRGFSSAVRTWLPSVDAPFGSVAAQRDDVESILNLTKKLTRLHKEIDGKAKLKDVFIDESRWIYEVDQFLVDLVFEKSDSSETISDKFTMSDFDEVLSSERLTSSGAKAKATIYRRR
ncbi:MAG: alpha-amylase family glycosyl hydrolase [Actinomycetota bacterium]|nr:alpha-amylase family glycosyl hydrolase [Actinomycetota bacterium]